MPKSKRAKIVNLTKTEKKGRKRKIGLLKKIQAAVEQFVYVYVIFPHNVRNIALKEFRQKLGSSRLFMGKNKVLQKALGTSPETELHRNLSKLSEKLIGYTGLLFTNEKRENIMKVVNACGSPQYARAGFLSTETIIFPKGSFLMPRGGTPQGQAGILRSVGVPLSYTHGQVELLGDYTVCKEGDIFTADQAKLVSLMGKKMAWFKVELICCWHDGVYEELAPLPYQVLRQAKPCASQTRTRCRRTRTRMGCRRR